MKRCFIIFIVLFCSIVYINAQNFSEYFVDKTLRVDYLFTGNSQNKEICLDEISLLPQWAGRRAHLSDLPLKGDGQVIVTDSLTGKCIYANSFSSLFNEWTSTDEARRVSRGFEHVVLIPFPIHTVKVQVTLCNSFGKVVTQIVHCINPTDVLIHQKGFSHVLPYRYLLRSGSYKDCIDVAIVGEGYTEKERDVFYIDAMKASNALCCYEPFKSLKNRFNVVAVFTPSLDSGVSIPQNKEWKNTIFMSHFNTFYSSRYLTTQHLKSINDVLAGIPYEHIIVLANTKQYGGGGIYNDYTMTAAHHPMFQPVIVHEFGHGFGGLADEYCYDGDVMDDTYPLSVEPWEQNITTRVNFASKWQDMLIKDTPVPTSIKLAQRYKIGVYEGAGYAAKGVFRPSYDCRMRSNQADAFCLVCQRALKRMIDFYTKP